MSVVVQLSVAIELPLITCTGWWEAEEAVNLPVP
jgi:hypothetical protein